MRVTALPSIGMMALALAACGSERVPCPVCAARAADEAARGRPTVPHGGTLIVAGDQSAYFEIVHDGEAQRVDLYLFDADMRPLAATDRPVLNLLRKGKSISIDGEGDADHWTFTNWRLGIEPEGRFRVEVGELIYVPTFAHTHAASTGHGHGDPAALVPYDMDAGEDDEDEDDED